MGPFSGKKPCVVPGKKLVSSGAKKEKSTQKEKNEGKIPKTYGNGNAKFP